MVVEVAQGPVVSVVGADGSQVVLKRCWVVSGPLSGWRGGASAVLGGGLETGTAGA